MALSADVLSQIVKKKPIFPMSPYNGVANSMMGNTSAFGRAPMNASGDPVMTDVMPKSPTNAFLPQNYGFNDLAGYEEQRRNALGTQFQNQITEAGKGISSSYDTALKNYQDTSAKRRADLSASLLDTGKKTFDLQNPSILEDLNSRGVFSSPTAVAQAQAQALKEIELANQNKLSDFDTNERSYEDTLGTQKLNQMNELGLAGTSANIQAQQDALDAGLDLRRGGLEAANASTAADKEQAMAEKLAAENRKSGITNALIGGGGSILGAALPSLLAKGTGAAGAGVAGATGATGAGVAGATGATGAGVAGATPAAGIGLGGAAAIGGAGLGAALLSRAADKKVSAVAGGQAGTAAGILANPIGAQLNFAKDLIKNPTQTVNKSLGIGAGKTGTNIGDNQAQMNQLYQGTQQLKQMLDSGEIDKQTYDSNVEQLTNQALVLLNRTASLDSKAATNIMPNFNQFVTSGLVNRNGSNFNSTVGNKYDITAALKAAGII